MWRRSRKNVSNHACMFLCYLPLDNMYKQLKFSKMSIKKKLHNLQHHCIQSKKVLYIYMVHSVNLFHTTSMKLQILQESVATSSYYNTSYRITFQNFECCLNTSSPTKLDHLRKIKLMAFFCKIYISVFFSC